MPNGNFVEWLPLVSEPFLELFGSDPLIHAFVGGIFIATLNLIGASLVSIWRSPTRRMMNATLGFAAGVMLAASFTSLIIPGIEGYADGNPIPVLVGVALGALALDRSDKLVPHAHYLLSGRRRPDVPAELHLPITDERLAGVVLFILAITLHNVPEGLAVGVGFGSGDVSNAIALMLAIGIQNIPEVWPSQSRLSMPGSNDDFTRYWRAFALASWRYPPHSLALLR